MAEKFGIEQSKIQEGLPIRPQFVYRLYDLLSGTYPATSGDEININGVVNAEAVNSDSYDLKQNGTFETEFENKIITLINDNTSSPTQVTPGDGLTSGTGTDLDIDLATNPGPLTLTNDVLGFNSSALAGDGIANSGGKLEISLPNTGPLDINQNGELDFNGSGFGETYDGGPNITVSNSNGGDGGGDGGDGGLVGQNSVNIISLNDNVTITGTLEAGTIRSTGDVIANFTSDRRLKSNITAINPEYAHEAITKVIEGSVFQWNDKQDTYEPRSEAMGIVAQDVEHMFPTLVTERDTGYKAVDYKGLIPVLIQAVRHQSKLIEDLEDKVDSLSNE